MDCSKQVVYQIYPKSFQDTTGNGRGDLNDITSHLDYLQDLGITMIWFNPIFPSPQKDNGYDVSNYTAINPDYGTMDDFETLVREAGKRGIGIMLDMVFNHTSTEHEWFQKALAGNRKYKDYYIWKKGKDGHLPTNWPSKFGGPAWQYVEKFDEYYLHLFDPTQADLNLANPDVRNELVNVLKFWIEKGVKGFRFDVVNLIDKMAFEDAPEGSEGKEFYTDGPKVNDYLHQLHVEALGNADVLTVGEMSATSVEKCSGYSKPENEELSMCFNFHHLKVDYKDKQKWTLMPFDFQELKDLFFEWDVKMEEEGGWNALFWNCHDQPRALSRFGDPVHYPKESAKMLASVIFTRRGTPYFLYGDEIGMTNLNSRSVADYDDVESHNAADMLKHEQHKSDDEILAILQAKSRDNSRTPMQWTNGTNGGFTSGQPWLRLNDNLETVNAESVLQEEDSIYDYYKKLIALKKTNPILQHGTTRTLLQTDKNLYAYVRELDSEEILCVHNFFGHPAPLSLDLHEYERILSNYSDFDPDALALRPYESLILKKKN